MSHRVRRCCCAWEGIPVVSEGLRQFKVVSLTDTELKNALQKKEVGVCQREIISRIVNKMRA